MKNYKLILDSHRGIYFGNLVETLEGGNACRLTEARHCFYFAAQPKKAEGQGVYALATDGPAKGSKIGPEVIMTVRDVAKIVDCSGKAVKAWKSATW